LDIQIGWVFEERLFGVVASKGLGCFKALAQIRGELSCAVCDNTKESFFKNPANLYVQPTNLSKLGKCIMFIRYLGEYKKLLNDMLDFAGIMGKDISTVHN
jgi:hypothetical protein